MTKGKKIILISSIIILVLLGVLLISKKLRLILGMGVSYTSNSDGKTYTLKMDSYGSKSTRILTASIDSTVMGQIYKDNGRIMWVGNLGSVEVTNPEDKDFLSKLL